VTGGGGRVEGSIREGWASTATDCRTQGGPAEIAPLSAAPQELTTEMAVLNAHALTHDVTTSYPVSARRALSRITLAGTL
jgi:hypothetical protein